MRESYDVLNDAYDFLFDGYDFLIDFMISYATPMNYYVIHMDYV